MFNRGGAAASSPLGGLKRIFSPGAVAATPTRTPPPPRAPATSAVSPPPAEVNLQSLFGTAKRLLDELSSTEVRAHARLTLRR